MWLSQRGVATRSTIINIRPYMHVLVLAVVAVSLLILMPSTADAAGGGVRYGDCSADWSNASYGFASTSEKRNCARVRASIYNNAGYHSSGWIIGSYASKTYTSNPLHSRHSIDQNTSGSYGYITKQF